MPTNSKPSNKEKELAALRAEIYLKHYRYLQLQKKINSESHNPDSILDRMNLKRLIKQRVELMRLAKKLSHLVVEYPNPVYIDNVCDQLADIGKTLKEKPVIEERLSYKVTKFYSAGRDDYEGTDYPAGSATHSEPVLSSYRKQENKRMAEEGKRFANEVDITRNKAMAFWHDIGREKARLVTDMLKTYAEPEKLGQKYNDLKSNSSGFPLSAFKKTKPMPEGDRALIWQISQELKQIYDNTPKTPEGSVNHELLTAQIRGCLSVLKAQTQMKASDGVQKVLNSLLKEPAIKGSSKKVDTEKDRIAYGELKRAQEPRLEKTQSKLEF
jgi:hypothetical protein